jgi:hypothetical protein
MARFRGLLSLVAALAVVAGAARAQTPIGTHSPAQAQAIIGARSRAAISALRNGQMTWFASYVHPTKGLHFSPYVHVQNGERVFSRAQLPFLPAHPATWWWGRYDGSGNPIRLRFAAYRSRFVYDRDFYAAPQVLFNTQVNRGNTLNNLNGFYSGAIFVEYHVPASSPGAMNWNSLWFVWQRHGSRWYLSGVAHDQWTI